MTKRLWEVARLGCPPAFETPEDMWSKALEYFEWCDSNPIDETKLFSFQGDITSGKAPHIRAMTQSGLCTFLNIGVSTWHDYKKKGEFSEVTSLIESVMYEQKFSGAAAGMLNANIIARDLGLVDKSSNDVSVSGVKSFSDVYGKDVGES